MSIARLRTLVALELTQRIRSVAWYVMLGIFALLLIGATVLAFTAFRAFASNGAGSGIYSTVVYIVLLLAVLVSPTLSGNAVNGDRDAATLAPVQVTLATTGEIILGKFLAAWITGLAFAVVAAPFMLLATAAGGVSGWVVVVSLVVLIVEIGVVAAIGVGLSGLVARPLFSVAATYLVVAALTVGTLLAFGLGGASIQSQATTYTRDLSYPGDAPACGMWQPDSGTYLDCGRERPPAPECGEWRASTYTVPRFDYVWWLLAANPFVILADATPTTLDPTYGGPVDLFGSIKAGVRQAQIAPELERRFDQCDPETFGGDAYLVDRTPYDEILATTAPSWFVGLLVQLVLAVGLLLGAWARTRTPARRLPPGTRIA